MAYWCLGQRMLLFGADKRVLGAQRPQVRWVSAHEQAGRSNERGSGRARVSARGSVGASWGTGAIVGP